MSKYEKLWNYIEENGTEKIKLTFAEAERILGFPLDHSFLTDKKESARYGYEVVKISLKEKPFSLKRRIVSPKIAVSPFAVLSLPMAPNNCG